MSTLALVRSPVRIPVGPARTLLVALVAALLSLSGSWIPSYWGDEAATVLSAERPLSTLWPMLGQVDAVHGVYYVFMHFWIAGFGASEFSTRLPSALAVGIGAAGVVVLARALFDGRLAIVAGLVFAILPRVTYMGAEARSYAIGTAIAVWCTWALLRARRIGGARVWLVYGILVAVALYLFLFLGLLLVVHAVWMLSTRDSWTARRRWALSVLLALLAAAPIVLVDIAQRHQVAFIANRHTVTFSGILFDQWFGAAPVAVVCWVLAVVGFVVARRLPAARLLIAWIVLPTLLLMVINANIAPAYNQRYLSFCTPPIAIAVALGIRALRRRPLQLVAAALLLAAVAPVYVAQRTPYAKDGGSDLAEVADYVASVAHPGDAVAFDNSTRPSRRPRLALRLYPAQFAGLDDVGLTTPFQQTSGLWDVVAPLSDRAAQLSGVRTVWLVIADGSRDAKSSLSAGALSSLGFAAGTPHHTHRETVTEFTRG